MGNKTWRDINDEFEKRAPELPPNPLTHNHMGWAYADRPNPAEVYRDMRIEAEIAQDKADQQKLDAQARRHAYRWKQRQMRQRGRRY